MDREIMQFNYYVKMVQMSSDRLEKKDGIEFILEKLRPFRYALAKKFANKGVEFDDLAQQIDLKLIESIYDYDEKKDPSALRHLVSKTRNGIWNFYRKEMNYFDEKKTTISLDKVFGNDEGKDISYHGYFVDRDGNLDENMIIEKILLEEEMAKLTPRQREVLLMWFIDDMTQYDIAEELNINQANVSRAKNRGIANIKNNVSFGDEESEIV